jgi:hypothetical protein
MFVAAAIKCGAIPPQYSTAVLGNSTRTDVFTCTLAQRCRLLVEYGGFEGHTPNYAPIFFRVELVAGTLLDVCDVTEGKPRGHIRVTRENSNSVSKLDPSANLLPPVLKKYTTNPLPSDVQRTQPKCQSREACSTLQHVKGVGVFAHYRVR